MLPALYEADTSRARTPPRHRIRPFRSPPSLPGGITEGCLFAGVLRFGSRSPAMSVTPVTIPEQIGRYRIEKELGQGGMGTVYLATDTELSRRVALKVPHLTLLREDTLRRFHREAKTLAQIDHPH